MLSSGSIVLFPELFGVTTLEDSSTEFFISCALVIAFSYTFESIRHQTQVKEEERIAQLRQEIINRTAVELEKQKVFDELQNTLKDIEDLSRIVPVCAGCKKLRQDGGYWPQVEQFLKEHTDLSLSHGYCPPCADKAREEIDRYFISQEHRDQGQR